MNKRGEPTQSIPIFQLFLASKDAVGHLELHGGRGRAAAGHRRDVRVAGLAGERGRPRGVGESRPRSILRLIFARVAILD